jgi:hypothetical protein
MYVQALLIGSGLAIFQHIIYLKIILLKNKKNETSVSFFCLKMIAGAGFEPATFGL